MYKQTLSLLFATAIISGCAIRDLSPEVLDNMVLVLMYENEPLISKVKKGVTTKEQVRSVGGPPLSEINNTVTPGTCSNYVFHHPKNGEEQPFYLSFDANGVVNHMGFKTCEQYQTHQKIHKK